MSVLPAILLSGLATYLTRVVPLLVELRPPPGGVLRRYLDALPTAVIAALAGAAVFAPQDRLTDGAEPLAALVTIGLALWRRNMLLAVIGGTAAVALARALSSG